MKKKTKRIMAGILSASIVLHTPMCVESAEAVGRISIPSAFKVWEYVIGQEKIPEEMSGETSEMETGESFGDNRSEIISEEISQDKSENMSESSSEDTTEEKTEEKSEDTTENSTENMTENVSENITEEKTEEKTEDITDNDTENDTEEEPEGATENDTEEEPEDAAENDTEEEPEDTTERDTEEEPEDAAERDTEEETEHTETEEDTDEETTEEIEKFAGIQLKVTDGGEFDYRDCVDGIVSPEISVSVVECTGSAPPEKYMNVDGDEEVPADELTDIHYMIELDQDNIVRPRYMETECVYDRSRSCFKDSMALDVIGVGETEYSVQVLGTCSYTVYPGYGRINVHNSSLFDSDFYIEVSGDGYQQDYTYDEWTAYLQSHDNWVDGNVNIRLSDEGKKYYTSIMSDETDESGSKKTYTLWAENPQRNASTKNEENGTRTYTVGIDTEAPVLTVFEAASRCYEPTKTDTEQYFAEDFVLNGSFRDSGSGVDRIEYTTNAAAGEQAEWMVAEVTEQGAETCKFQITLSEGYYDAIAVRAYDMLGNISAEQGFVNDQGSYITRINA